MVEADFYFLLQQYLSNRNYYLIYKRVFDISGNWIYFEVSVSVD